MADNWPKSGLTRYQKDGAAGCFRSYIGYLDGKNNGVVILVAGTEQPDSLGTDILTALANN